MKTIALILALATSASALSYTTDLTLAKPTTGDTNYVTPFNTGMDTLDAAIPDKRINKTAIFASSLTVTGPFTARSSVTVAAEGAFSGNLTVGSIDTGGLADFSGVQIYGSQVYADAGALWMGTSASWPVNIGTAGNTELTVRLGGNVGIGDTVPQARLVVNGNIVSSGTISGTAIVGPLTGAASLNVLKAGDTMSGPLTLSGSSLTVTGLINGNYMQSGRLNIGNGFGVTTSPLFVLNNVSPTTYVVKVSSAGGENMFNIYGNGDIGANTNGGNFAIGALTGDGAKLYVAGNATVTGSAFSVGGSTLVVSGGFTVHNVQNKATINAMNGVVGGVVTCSDCTNTYTLCVGTGTAKGAFREVGTATNCN